MNEMTSMKAPPSNKAEIVDVPFAFRDLVARHSPGGRYIDAQTDVDSPWVPVGEHAAIKHLAFDVRSNTFSNILWVKSAGAVGTPLHRGTIVMVCLEGSVRYLEYDGVASPGGLILEVPGEAHTLTGPLAARPIAESVPELVEVALRNGGAKCDNVTIIAMEWESATDEDTPGVSTDELGDEVFASTIQASLGSNAGPGDNVEDDDLDEAAIERSIREINEAIRRSANGTRKV